jgi:hypothetical protein
VKGREINGCFSQGEQYKDKYVNISLHCQVAPAINFTGQNKMGTRLTKEMGSRRKMAQSIEPVSFSTGRKDK